MKKKSRRNKSKTTKNKLIIRVFNNNYELSALYTDKLIGYSNENNISYPNNFPYLLKSKVNGIESLRDALNEKKIVDVNNNKIERQDIEICLGSEHIVYSILENFIRNAAKHNKGILNATKKDLEIILKIDDTRNDPDFYNLLIYDNVSRVTAETLLDLQKGVDADLFESDGQLSRSSLGIADMKINAYLLQTVDEIDNDKLKQAIQILYCKDCEVPEFYDSVVNSDNKNSLELLKELEKTVDRDEKTNHSFAYKLKLTKPKKILWIGRKDINDDDKLSWNRKGVIFKNNIVDTFTINQNNASKLLAAYSFAILEKEIVKDLNEDDFDNLLLQLPFRVLINCPFNQLEKGSTVQQFYQDRRLQTVEIPLVSEGFDDFKLLKSCWENWFKRWLKKVGDGCVGYEKAHLYIYLQDGQDGPQIRKWNEIIDKQKFPFEITFIEDRTYNLNTKPTLNNNEYVIFFDRHGVAFDEKCNISSPPFLFGKQGSYFELDKSSDDFGKLFYPSSDRETNILLLFEAVEAGLMRISILDERIAAKIDNTDENVTKIRYYLNGYGFTTIDPTKESTYADLMNNGNTFVITGFLSEQSLTKIENWRMTYIDDVININPPNSKFEDIKYDGLIIHRTYLNKLLDKRREFCPDDNTEINARELMKVLNKQFKRVVVTSGGGYPHSLPEKVKVRFQPYNLVNRSFVKYHSKISLIRLL